MTVYAVGLVTSASIDHAAGNYNLVIAGTSTNGVSDDGWGGSLVFIPLGTSAKKADKMLRDAAAAEIFAAFGYTIDPSDIYFPAP